MKYEVFISGEAQLEMEEVFDWLVARSSLHGPLWYNDLVDAIFSLDELAPRCPLAPERAHFVEEVRQLIHGGKRHGYRILFATRGQKMMVLHERHGARRHLEN